MMLLLLLLLVAAILCAAVWAWPWLRMIWKARNLRGPSYWATIGHAFEFLRYPEQTFNLMSRLFEEHGPVVKVLIGPELTVIVSDPADGEAVLKSHESTGRGQLIKKTFGSFIGISLFTSEGETARARRRLVAPAFHAAQLTSYVDAFARNTDEMCARFAKTAEDRTVDIKAELSRYSLTTICETVVGVRLNYDSRKWNETRDQILGMFELLSRRLVIIWLDIGWLFSGKALALLVKASTDIFNDAITKKRETKSKANDAAPDRLQNTRSFLDIAVATLASSGVPALTETQFREEFNGLLAAGTDTTASAMAYALILLAVHPDHQQLVLEEQRAIFGDSLRAATVDDMTRMTTLETVVKETLRLFPSVPIVPRHVPVDVVLPGGAFVPAGATAFVSVYHMHRDAANFAEPARFWPERWLPENDVKRHPGAYMPFGAGTRKCIGYKYAWLQMKGTLSRVLREFRVECRYTMGDLQRLVAGITLTSAVGYDVQLHAR